MSSVRPKTRVARKVVQPSAPVRPVKRSVSQVIQDVNNQQKDQLVPSAVGALSLDNLIALHPLESKLDSSDPSIEGKLDLIAKTPASLKYKSVVSFVAYVAKNSTNAAIKAKAAALVALLPKK